MAETLTKTRKEQAFDDWLEALRSGDYKQGEGVLCANSGSDQRQYCCVGVLDEVVFNAKWEPALVDASVYRDEDGNVYNLDRHSYKVTLLGLDEYLTEGEIDSLSSYIPDADTNTTRLAALAAMNDHGVDFDTIAMIIEDVVEWKVK